MRSSCRRGVQIAVALVLLIAAGEPALSGSSAVPARPDDKTILHVLNRLGFGPRPGDVTASARWGSRSTSTSSSIPTGSRTARWRRGSRASIRLTMSSRSLADDYFMPAQCERARKRRRTRRRPAAHRSPMPPRKNARPNRWRRSESSARSRRAHRAEDPARGVTATASSKK